MEEISEHDNEFTITSDVIIPCIEYRLNSIYVSQGQNPKGRIPQITKVDDGKWKIVLRCGRHKTTSVANSFKGVTGGNETQMLTSYSGNTSPDQLNFYFGLNITFSSGAYGNLDNVIVYLGQGSYAFGNNWWFGSTNLVSVMNRDTAVLFATLSGKIIWKSEVNMDNSSCNLKVIY